MSNIDHATPPLFKLEKTANRPQGRTAPSKRYYMLDAMRGIAAIIVLFHHMGSSSNLMIFRAGSLAVDFFFALSGFVLAAAYDDRLKKGLTFKQFMEMRLIRLYPLLLIGMLFGVIKGAGQIVLHDDLAMSMPHYVLAAFLSLFLLPNVTNSWLFPLNAPIWSLFFELIINIAFALAFYRLKRVGLVTVCIVSGIWLAVSTIALGDASAGDQWNAFGHASARVIFSFTVGLLIWNLRSGKDRRYTWLSLLPALALIFALWPNVTGTSKAFYDIAIILGVLPAIVYAGAAWDVPALGKGSATFLGDVSYPVYVVHYPIVGMAWVLLRHFVSPTVYLIGVATLIVGFCWVLARKVDEPIRARLSAAFHLRRSGLRHKLPE